MFGVFFLNKGDVSSKRNKGEFLWYEESSWRGNYSSSWFDTWFDAAMGCPAGLTHCPGETRRPPVGDCKESAPSWWGGGMEQCIGTHMHDLLGLFWQVVGLVWAHTEQEHPSLQLVHGQSRGLHANELVSLLLVVTGS